jgi:Tfp pilus assembly protein PilF
MASAEVELAKLHLAGGRLKEAEQFAQSALGKVGGYVEAQLLLARINLLRGDSDKAEAPLLALGTRFPDSPAVQN